MGGEKVPDLFYFFASPPPLLFTPKRWGRKSIRHGILGDLGLSLASVNGLPDRSQGTYTVSLGLNFLICKMEIVSTQTWPGHCESEVRSWNERHPQADGGQTAGVEADHGGTRPQQPVWLRNQVKLGVPTSHSDSWRLLSVLYIPGPVPRALCAQARWIFTPALTVTRIVKLVLVLSLLYRWENWGTGRQKQCVQSYKASQWWSQESPLSYQWGQRPGRNQGGARSFYNQGDLTPWGRGSAEHQGPWQLSVGDVGTCGAYRWDGFNSWHFIHKSHDSNMVPHLSQFFVPSPTSGWTRRQGGVGTADPGLGCGVLILKIITGHRSRRREVSFHFWAPI